MSLAARYWPTAKALGRHYCQLCMTEIPLDRERCIFHTKRLSPPPESSPHPEVHIPRDLMPLYDLILQPLTFDEIAQRMGPGVTRRVVDTQWNRLRLALGLRSQGRQGRLGIDRLMLLRMHTRLDQCFCRRETRA